jgi:DMSO/TMAO reductase YedYZ molybdopterin-dependent catalytic subunit
MKTKQIITTRRALMTGIASAGGLLLGGCSKQLPPTYGNVLRMGDLLTYTAHRLLLPRERLAKEYAHGDITSIPAVGTTNPADSHQEAFSAENGPAYERLQAGGFADYRLSITGRVSRPGSYSLADLKRFPARTQITKHTCEEGWSAIAEWTGVPLRNVLKRQGFCPAHDS